MNLQKIDIRLSYRNRGENNIIDNFLVPALKEANVYKRSVGFFSSSVFELYNEGLDAFIANGGHMYLICSPELSSIDKSSIKQGYSLKELYSKQIEDDITKTLEDMSLDKLTLLSKLIASDNLDILVVDVLDDDFEKAERGIYHDKIGILSDNLGNEVLFVGSANESKNAYSGEGNYEKIRVSASWRGESERIKDDENEFDEIWGGTNPYIKTRDVTNLISVKIHSRLDKNNASSITSGVQLREYQKEAIQSWINNDYRGFFVMATGTGKTWTAIYASLEVMKKEPVLLVVCAPYKHLVKQWQGDIEKVMPEITTVLVSSENPSWEDELKNAIFESKYTKKRSVVVISTIISFGLERFEKTVCKCNMERMLIVDEAHRFKNRDSKLKEKYRYMLGLSATPSSKRNDVAAEELMNFFGGQVYYLPIEFAIEKNYLVHYNYYPIYVHATTTEMQSFDNITRQMMGCFKNGKCIDVEKLARLKRDRLRIIAMAEEKITSIDRILSMVEEDDHFIIYCGDGTLHRGIPGEEQRHIEFVRQRLISRGYTAGKFTATESMAERMELVDMFNRGTIDSLVAIRCLDEGINIPSINGALILASNDDYREFVQRRGRILRTYTNEYSGKEKKKANIYDVIVLPDPDKESFARIELRREYEYMRLADNEADIRLSFDNLCAEYGIDIDEFVDMEDTEADLDE